MLSDLILKAAGCSFKSFILKSTRSTLSYFIMEATGSHLNLILKTTGRYFRYFVLKATGSLTDVGHLTTAGPLIHRCLRHSEWASFSSSTFPVRFKTSGQILDQSHNHNHELVIDYWRTNVIDRPSVQGVWWSPLISSSISWLTQKKQSSSWGWHFSRWRVGHWWLT